MWCQKLSNLSTSKIKCSYCTLRNLKCQISATVISRSSAATKQVQEQDIRIIFFHCGSYKDSQSYLVYAQPKTTLLQVTFGKKHLLNDCTVWWICERTMWKKDSMDVSMQMIGTFRSSYDTAVSACRKFVFLYYIITSCFQCHWFREKLYIDEVNEFCISRI